MGHPIYGEMDVEALKIILSELNPIEIEHVNVSHEEIEALYKNLLEGCSRVGNIDCIKLLLNRIEFLSKTQSEMNTWGVNAEFIHLICKNVWIYYAEFIGYDLEMSIHSIMQLLQCMLGGDNKLWRSIISQETISEYVILMAESSLFAQMGSLKELMQGGNENFAEIITALDDVDFTSVQFQEQQASHNRLYEMQNATFFDYN